MSDLVAAFVRAQLAGDRLLALRVVDDALAQGLSIPELHLQVIRAAQLEIGSLWENNEISVAQEHAATAISNLVLAQLYGRLPRKPRNGRIVLLACVDGELHELGPRIASDFLEMAGFEVHYIGAGVPTESLLRRIRMDRPDLVALSMTMGMHAPTLKDAVQRLRAEFPNVPILVGGYAFDFGPELGRFLGVEHHGTDAATLVSMAERLLGTAA